jgi:hypothetical protein
LPCDDHCGIPSGRLLQPGDRGESGLRRPHGRAQARGHPIALGRRGGAMTTQGGVGAGPPRRPSCGSKAFATGSRPHGRAKSVRGSRASSRDWAMPSPTRRYANCWRWRCSGPAAWSPRATNTPCYSPPEPRAHTRGHSQITRLTARSGEGRLIQIAQAASGIKTVPPFAFPFCGLIPLTTSVSDFRQCVI